MISKDNIIDRANYLLSVLTGGSNPRFDPEHRAPVVHAIVQAIVDEVNDELDELRRSLRGMPKNIDPNAIGSIP